MVTTQDFIKTTKDFYHSWLFGFEKEDVNIDWENTNYTYLPEYDLDSERFRKMFDHWIKTVEILKRIKSALTNRVIKPSLASNIHGLNNRQINYWEENGIMPFKKEKGKRRRYSIVDIAWILILKQFQDKTNSQPQKIAEQIRYFLEDDILALSLSRDIEVGSSIVALFPNPKKEAIWRYGQSDIISLQADLSVIVPISNIVEYVSSITSEIDLTTFQINGKRYMKFSGSLDSIDLHERLDIDLRNGILSSVFSFFGSINEKQIKSLTNSLDPVLKPLQESLEKMAREHMNQTLFGESYDQNT